MTQPSEPPRRGRGRPRKDAPPVIKPTKPPKTQSTRPGACGSTPPIAYRWKPGQSGNPAGRPSGDRLTMLVREEMRRVHDGGRTMGEIVATAVVRGVIKATQGGDPRLLQELWNRMDGKLKEAVEARLEVDDARSDAKRKLLDELARHAARAGQGRDPQPAQ